ncbi:succinate dehydrogenase / fumarate reductase iron-sulfur subunit/fumarate reductase iron-sulfur subunit [Salsuginibacillus halophilus]|uniref:Fumarate reductase iron-sulfur subunit n=1 Tax=Salsuginibacillus halophilus TaxID=517424 RepID=A0A2P8HKZ5_9BACI|nr:succinate dehydrogenase iron-sulfur subunit [Salsuginibacillus halophilus]PSL46897.1 succinate dehydrogenase / fumarate reductase iron-sulfur subunit/fumarate reductase iron-sulfur subunit [Salsuginibacillus halophilus]
MEKVQVSVMRYEPETDESPYYETFEIQPKKNMTVLDTLFLIVEDQDASLSFRCACRLGMCGTCGMMINGRGRLSCRTKVEALGSEIKVEPMRNFPVIKDIAVDMEPFFDSWQKVQPYFVPKEDTDEFSIIPHDDKARQVIDKNTDCITCGLCYQSCDVVSMRDGEFLGPAALTRAHNLIADERDGATHERLEKVTGSEGAFECHSFGACMEVCPKGINPMESIQKIKTKKLKKTLGLKI